MSGILGCLYPLADGRYQGVLRALVLHIQIELRPSASDKLQQAFDIYARGEFLAGRAVRSPPEGPTIHMVLRSPDLVAPLEALATQAPEGWVIHWVDND